MNQNQKASLTPTQDDIAYASGFFDGEGCVSVQSANRHGTRESFRIHCSLRNTELGALRWLQARWGGSVYPIKHSSAHAHWSPIWVWHVFGDGMQSFLEDISALVKIKGPAINNGLDALRAMHRQHRPRARHSDSTLDELRQYHARHVALGLRRLRNQAQSESLDYPQTATRAPTREDIAYAAGLFDGEGCVNVYRSVTLASGREIFKVQCLLGNTDLGVLKWLRERWAGHVYNQTRRSQPGWNRVFQWHVIPNERRLTFLEDIRPFLKVAAPATDNALAILRLKRDHFQTGQPYSDFVYASLRQGYERHMALALRPKRLKVGSVLDD